jgi:hypothetical protein
MRIAASLEPPLILVLAGGGFSARLGPTPTPAVRNEPMSQIQKFSLIYDVAEDRMGWDSEDIQGATTRLWLTQRLCRGLVGAVLPMLQGQPATPEPVAPQRQAVVQSWEQAAAMADFGKVPGVRPQPQTVVGLVRAVHIRPFSDRMDLTFEFGADQTRTIGVSHPAVRQMLSVLHRLYAAAGWQMDIWPAWIAGPQGSPPTDAVN